MAQTGDFLLAYLEALQDFLHSFFVSIEAVIEL
jgi:hypothetical protein